MVLDDVADDARLFVELAPALHAEALGHGDLDTLDIVAIPDRLEERVREPEVEDVLYRLLSEVVVDPEDALFGKHLVQDAVQLHRRLQIAAERLLDHHAASRVKPASASLPSTVANMLGGIAR